MRPVFAGAPPGPPQKRVYRPGCALDAARARADASALAGGSTLRAACLLACVLAVPSGVARADLWGYLDADGVAHFATERLDERYQLFYKGETNVDAAARARGAAPADGDFSHSRIFQYVTRHPNAAKFAQLIERNATSNGLDPALVKAVIAVESGFDPAAVSDKGALGLMQVAPRPVPATAWPETRPGH